MHCTNCKNEIPDNANFCPQCGSQCTLENEIKSEDNQNELQDFVTIDFPKLKNNAIPLEFVLVPEGEFLMGNTQNIKNNNRETVHRVKISNPFYLGKYPVTQAQWNCVMNTTPSFFGYGPNHPVEQISWRDCENFLFRLNSKNLGFFRLPTDTEWEYACRGGTRTINYWGNSLDENDLNQYAWYASNSGGMSHPVGMKKPNPFGLYDMQGNVWEWCKDWFGNISPHPTVDPIGPSSGNTKVIRGGSFLTGKNMISSYKRVSYSPANKHKDLGVRLVMMI